ncbi:hypothetical protein K503DRAFT_130441 [Rhizopogon vinicolor AM-OR11-026]|uniref:Uncharacterized protein n=1 Tax=Rhizopogon vinicolor AM-OR11-026 TaxID=1314800 RepID=A0A1B7MEK6_9AGAM|nr:hypothetical protein K503DRAFT_130441 [Rhizopogon vinicolor AM-OR11-026]
MRKVLRAAKDSEASDVLLMFSHCSYDRLTYKTLPEPSLATEAKLPNPNFTQQPMTSILRVNLQPATPRTPALHTDPLCCCRHGQSAIFSTGWSSAANSTVITTYSSHGVYTST